MTDFQLSISLSRPFGTQFLDIFVSRHCAFGLYRVIHIPPFQGDYLKSPYIVASLRDAFLDVFVSRHCTFGLYRVIHIQPFQGDYLKYPYIVAALRDAVLGCLCVTALRLRLVPCYSYPTLSG